MIGNRFRAGFTQGNSNRLQKYVKLQAVQRTESNRLVKVTRWHVEKFVVAERTGRNRISFIPKQTCDVVAHSRNLPQRQMQLGTRGAEELAEFIVRDKRSWFPMFSEVPWNFRLLGPKHRPNFEIHNA